MGNVIFTIYVRINCNKIQLETKYFLFLLEEMENDDYWLYYVSYFWITWNDISDF